MPEMRHSPTAHTVNDAPPIMTCTQVDEFSRPMEPIERANSFPSPLTTLNRQKNECNTIGPYVVSAGDSITPSRENRATQNDEKIATNLAGDDINDNAIASIYQRKNSKPLSIVGRESAPSTPTHTARMNRTRYILKRPAMRPSPFALPPHSTQSIYSHDLHGPTAPSPSTDREKRKITRRFLATTLGIIYAMFLVVFSAIVFIGDVVVSQHPLPQAFCIYMLATSFAYFLFLYIDIRLHVHRAKLALEDREARHQLIEEYISKLSIDFDGRTELRDESDVNAFYSRALQDLHLPPIQPVSHKYCFMTGRHGEFLYLKLGAVWFAIGLLIHSSLQISYQVFFIWADGAEFHNCASYITLALDILFPLYAWFILFFIVKYINVIINEHRSVARLFLLHAIGTSLALWIFTIVSEAAGAITHYHGNFTAPNTTVSDPHQVGSSEIDCAGVNALNTIHQRFSPYLYPFIIEYCILNVGIWYMMWANINRCPRKMSQTSADSSMESGQISLSSSSVSSDMMAGHADSSTDHDNDFKTHSFVYADCHSSVRGIFAGLTLLILTVVFIILLFIGIEKESFFHTSIMINDIFELTVMLVMAMATIAAYLQTAKLDINSHPVSKLDDILLFIAIPAFIMDTTFTLVPAIANKSTLKICLGISQIVQVLIQTPFIIDGLRRCSNALALRRKKPGRELIVFLTISNVSLWIFYTFSVKMLYKGDERYEFYGFTLWKILNHISMPLIMFYRFHSSVCLVDIWRHSYEPAPLAH